MSLRFVLLCSCLLASSVAAADVVAYRCTGPAAGPVRAIVDDHGACRGFVTAGKEQHFSRMVSGTLLASKDGKTVVMIEDYLSGIVDGSNIVGALDRERIVNPTVVQIWHDGKRVGAYDVARLVKDVSKVGTSISHVRWTAKLPATIDARFAIVTTSGREITFDSKVGVIVDERDVPTRP